jgi:NAD+--asparagine ADP-ribosyltransferase
MESTTNGSVRLSTQIPRWLKTELVNIAKDRGDTFNNVVRDSLKEYLKNQEEQNNE